MVGKTNSKSKAGTATAPKKTRGRVGGAMGWHIVGWEERYEIPLAHRRDGRAGPLEYTKDYIQGVDDESIAARASQERLRQWANWLELNGAFGELKRRAGLRSRTYRGYLLDDRHRAAGPAMIAQWLGCSARKAATILARLSEVNLLERVRMPRFAAPKKPDRTPPPPAPKKGANGGGKKTAKKRKTVLSKTRKSALAGSKGPRSSDSFFNNARFKEGGNRNRNGYRKEKEKENIGSEEKEKRKAQGPRQRAPVPSPPAALESEDRTGTEPTAQGHEAAMVYRIDDYRTGNRTGTEPTGLDHTGCQEAQQGPRPAGQDRSDPTCPTESDGPGGAQQAPGQTILTESDGSRGPQQQATTVDASGPGPSIPRGASEGLARGASEGLARGASEGLARGASEGLARGASEGSRQEAWDYEAFADQVMEALRYPHEPDRLWWRQERGTWMSQWDRLWRLCRAGTLDETALRRIWHGTLKEAARCVKCYGKPGRPLTKRGKVCCGLMNEQVRRELAAFAAAQARASPALSS